MLGRMERQDAMEQPLITAVTYSTSEAQVTLFGVPNEEGAAAHIFGALADADVIVDIIVQNQPASASGQAEISFTVLRQDLERACASIEPLQGRSFTEMRASKEMGQVSIVGAGMRSHPEVAAEVFRTLAQGGINIGMISTSPIKISCVIPLKYVHQAVRLLQEVFGLSGEDAIEEDTFQAKFSKPEGPPPLPFPGETGHGHVGMGGPIAG